MFALRKKGQMWGLLTSKTTLQRRPVALQPDRLPIGDHLLAAIGLKSAVLIKTDRFCVGGQYPKCDLGAATRSQGLTGFVHQSCAQPIPLAALQQIYSVDLAAGGRGIVIPAYAVTTKADG